ncbi:MAG: NUDIX hydrolase [Anaerovoracaceae bacterium]
MIFREETLSSERIYEGRIVNLRKDKVTVKSGTSSREIVEHNGGAVAVALTKENKLVMVKQFRKAVERVVLELPAGKLEGDEDPEEAVKRELREETGYVAGTVSKLSTMLPSVGYTQERLHIYLAEDLVGGETDFDENEARDLVDYDGEGGCEMIMKGEIQDAKTIIGVLMTKMKRGL